MKAISRRLARLEQRFGLVEETWETKILRARLEAARLRLEAAGPRPQTLLPNAEHMAERRRASIVDILNAARDRLAFARLTG